MEIALGVNNERNSLTLTRIISTFTCNQNFGSCPKINLDNTIQYSKNNFCFWVLYRSAKRVVWRGPLAHDFLLFLGGPKILTSGVCRKWIFPTIFEGTI